MRCAVGVNERDLYAEIDRELREAKKVVEADGYQFDVPDALGAIAPILRKHFFENS